MSIGVPQAVPASAPPFRTRSVLGAVWKLIRLRMRITYTGFRHARTRRKIAIIIGLIALAAFAGLIFWLSWTLLGVLRSPELAKYVGDTSSFIQAVPVLIFTALFLGILLTSFGVLLQALYLSGDMDFLLAAPLPIRSLFITKLLQAVLPNFSLTALFGLPILYGLGASSGYNFLYYPMVLIMMVCLSLAAAGLAGLFVMLIVRIFPARRVAEVLGFVGAILSIVCSQSGNLMNASRGSADISNEQVRSGLGLLAQVNNPWYPFNWAGSGLVALGEGNWLPGVGLTLLSLGLAGAAFWFSLVTAERWYYTGWAGMQVIAQKKRPVGSSAMGTKAGKNQQIEEALTRISTMPLLNRLLPFPVRGLIWKDTIMMRRDLRYLSQLVTPLIFGIIYGIMFLRGGGEPPAGRGEAPAWFMDSLRALFGYGNILLSIFVGWMLLQRLAGMGFSAEGKNYWMLKAAPLSARQLLTAKFLVAYLPSLFISTIFLISFSILQQVTFDVAAYSLFVLALCLSGMSGIQLAFGAAGANLVWEDPRKMNAGNMGCVGMVLTVLYTPLNLGAFLAPLFLATLFGLPQGYAYLVGGVLGGVMSLLCAWLPPRLLEKRVERLGES